MKIAAAQIDTQLGNIEKNIEKHIQFCENALKEKANLIVFPELSLTGYSLKDINTDVAIDVKDTFYFKEFLKLSKNISINLGFVEIDSEYNIYNASAYFEDNEIKHIHRKIYPPTYGLFEENRYFSKGKSLKSFDSKYCRTGILICEDMWHISLPYLLAMEKSKLILGLAASPTRLSNNSEKFMNYEINSEHHRTFARLLSLYFVFSNRVGFEDGINFWGGSEIIDPFGNVLIAAKHFEEDLIYANIDLNEIRKSRVRARHFLDEDPEFTLKVLKNINKE